MTKEKTLHTAQILSGIAHDLRSPLNAIIGFSRLMLKGIDGPLSDDQTADLQAIQANGKAMLRVVDNLIDWARLESGELAFGEERFYLQPLLEKIGAANSKTTYITSDNAENHSALLSPIRADRPSIQQALKKTVEAASYIASQGHILVSTESADRYIDITFECTASQGLASETPQIVEAFLREGAVCEGRLDPTSLSLLIAQRLITHNNGSLTVEQKSPAWLVITIRLFKDPSSTQQEGPHTITPLGSRAKLDPQSE